MSNRKYEVFFWFAVFCLAIGFFFLVRFDRSNAQVEGEDITVEGDVIVNGSTTTEVPLKSAEQIFFELPYEVKYTLTLEKKEAADNLASKYAKLYDTCRFSR